MMSNPTVPAAADGMPASKRPFDYSTAFSNVTNVLELVCDLLIVNYSEVGETCVLPATIADQVIATLVMTRDACQAKLAEEVR